MSIRAILTFPDPRLREVSQVVQNFGSELKLLADDMLETMYASKGIGLAAPQIGEFQRFVVVDTRPKDEKGRYNYEEMTELEKTITQPLLLVNPEVITQKGKTTFDEGCLSVPSFYETVERAEVIELKYQDLYGKENRLKVDGLLAICIQHEIDHLQGQLFIDRISFIKSNKIKNQIKKHGYPENKPEGSPRRKGPVREALKKEGATSNSSDEGSAL